MPPNVIVHPLPTLTPHHIASLTDLLIACVEAGCSVTFMHPLPRPNALASWPSVAASQARDERILLAAEDPEATTLGTVPTAT